MKDSSVVAHVANPRTIKDLEKAWPHLKQPKTKPFRGTQGHRITRVLFYEQWTLMPDEKRTCLPVFTLSTPREGFICFGKHYVESEDPTGYTTATELLGEYQSWEVLLQADWFKEEKAKWDVEMDARLRSKALKQIRLLAMGEDAKALAAAKFLANMEHRLDSPRKPRRGRPTTEEVQGALKEEKDAQKALQSDLERIGLVKG